MEKLQWHTPPRCQGQIVEIAYASDGEWIYRRTVDRSGPTGRLERTPYPAAAAGRWRTWWRTPDDAQAADLDGGTYEAQSEAHARAQSEAHARRAVAERQLRIIPEVECEPAPFTFEPWNEAPELEGVEWEPVELESDGATWQPGGFKRLDLDGYGALVMPPDDAPAPPVEVQSDGTAWHPGGFARLDLDGYGALTFDGGGFVRLADGAWVRLGSTPERLDAPPIAYAGDWPGARATLATVELGCECGCACEGAALELRGGAWLCADCAAGEHAPCPRCGQRAELRTCERCERSAWVVDCGHYAQPRPIAADECGRALCDDCAGETTRPLAEDGEWLGRIGASAPGRYSGTYSTALRALRAECVRRGLAPDAGTLEPAPCARCGCVRHDARGTLCPACAALRHPCVRCHVPSATDARGLCDVCRK